MAKQKTKQDNSAHHSTRHLVGRMWHSYMSGFTGLIVPSMLLLALSAGVSGAQAWLIQPAIDKALIAGDPFYIWATPAAILLVSFIKGTASYGQTVLMNKMGFNLIAAMQADMMRSVLKADIAKLHGDGSGNLITRFINDSYIVREAAVKSITGMARDMLTVAIMIGVMFWQSWQLAAITFIVFPLSVVPIAMIGRKLRRVSRDLQERTADLTTLLDDQLKGIKLVKSYCAEDFAMTRATGLFGWIAKLNLRAVEVRSRSYPILETLGGLSVSGLILLGSFEVAAGRATPGEIMSFLGALMMAYQPMRGLANLNASLQQGLASAQRSFEVIDIEPSIEDRAEADTLRLTDGAIRFDKVTFAYASERPVLRDLSLDVPAGKRVALVGPSGAGKTTIFNLLMRLYEPTSGTVSIDAQDITGVSLRSLRANIALVSQEATVFNDTALGNIAFAEENPDRERAMAAAKAAEAHEFISALEEGYDTQLGEMGNRLSGGQRQRLSIARAIYKNAPILLLDEATSALDTETEALVQTALERLMQGRTVLMIAHRLSTIMEADLIYVLENGRLVESGRHADLVSNGGLYARLHRVA